MSDGRAGDWIQTYSGRQFWPCDPRPEDVDIADIAHALSMQCRYSGHCTRFYSVAEHSVLVSLHVPDFDALHGLLHDASEAYLSDVPRPIKPFLLGYGEMERRVQAAVYERFGLEPTDPPSVKRIDAALLADEQQQIMASPPVPWFLPEPPIGARVAGLKPEDAKAAFLDRYRALAGLR